MQKGTMTPDGCGGFTTESYEVFDLKEVVIKSAVAICTTLAGGLAGWTLNKLLYSEPKKKKTSDN